MKNLRILREQFGLSQQKLADLFNLSQQSIYKYENNLAEPDFQTIRQFADYFHTSVDYLLDYTDNPAPTKALVTIEYTSLELKHLELYRKLSPSLRKNLDAMLTEITYDKDTVLR
ncbi:MAG: helix-turn-helix domain-containing protein [Roseburia sp.]|nr:helix-turn-helix domain-containing protein [Roseburia sp.]